MKNPLNEYIEKQKNESPSPFFVKRIVLNINEIEKQEERRLKTTLWRSIVVAASFAAVVMMGVALGNSYQTKTPEQDVLLIDDRYMEHLYIFQNTKATTNE